MTYTTSITLSRAWLTDPADSTFAIVAGTRQSQDWTHAQAGTIRAYARGRRQAAVNDAVAFTVPRVFVGLSFDDVEVLKTKIGKTLLFRSRIGERLFCVFFDIGGHNVDRSTANDGRGFDVTLQFFEVDFDESSG